MNKATVDGRLAAAIAALTTARTDVQSKTDYDLTSLGASLQIRATYGTVILTDDGEVAYVPDIAATDSIKLAEFSQRNRGYITGAAGAKCPTCGGTGSV